MTKDRMDIHVATCVPKVEIRGQLSTPETHPLVAISDPSATPAGDLFGNFLLPLLIAPVEIISKQNNFAWFLSSFEWKYVFIHFFNGLWKF